MPGRLAPVPGRPVPGMPAPVPGLGGQHQCLGGNTSAWEASTSTWEGKPQNKPDVLLQKHPGDRPTSVSILGWLVPSQAQQEGKHPHQVSPTRLVPPCHSSNSRPRALPSPASVISLIHHLIFASCISLSPLPETPLFLHTLPTLLHSPCYLHPLLFTLELNTRPRKSISGLSLDKHLDLPASQDGLKWDLEWRRTKPSYLVNTAEITEGQHSPEVPLLVVGGGGPPPGGGRRRSPPAGWRRSPAGGWRRSPSWWAAEVPLLVVGGQGRHDPVPGESVLTWGRELQYLNKIPPGEVMGCI